MHRSAAHTHTWAPVCGAHAHFGSRFAAHMHALARAGWPSSAWLPRGSDGHAMSGYLEPRPRSASFAWPLKRLQGLAECACVPKPANTAKRARQPSGWRSPVRRGRWRRSAGPSPAGGVSCAEHSPWSAQRSRLARARRIQAAALRRAGIRLSTTWPAARWEEQARQPIAAWVPISRLRSP